MSAARPMRSRTRKNLLSPALAAFDEAFAATPVADDEEADSGAEDLAAAVEDAEHEPAEETAGPQDDTNIAAEAPDPVAEDEADTEEDAGAEETVSEESASEEVGAEESVTEDTAAPEEIAATAEEQPEAEDVRQEAPVEAKETIADLKPAQPDTFSGRTFLGASAAALVGSLAKFTSKSPAKTPQIRKQPEEPEQPAETAQSDDAGNQTDREAGTAPTPMDDERTEDLTAAEEETTFEADADAPLEETGPAPDEPSMEDEQEDDGQAEAEEELTGISGPAPLKPAEIESAVKTLAKSYKAVEVKPRDLFDAEQAASGEAPPLCRGSKKPRLRLMRLMRLPLPRRSTSTLAKLRQVTRSRTRSSSRFPHLRKPISTSWKKTAAHWKKWLPAWTGRTTTNGSSSKKPLLSKPKRTLPASLKRKTTIPSTPLRKKTERQDHPASDREAAGRSGRHVRTVPSGATGVPQDRRSARGAPGRRS
ncbi:hypothetical protein QW131_00270 [Roseibium salinum]|nr:hypothetical protein [Roseibium salinum]